MSSLVRGTAWDGLIARLCVNMTATVVGDRDVLQPLRQRSKQQSGQIPFFLSRGRTHSKGRSSAEIVSGKCYFFGIFRSAIKLVFFRGVNRPDGERRSTMVTLPHSAQEAVRQAQSD